MKNQIRKYFSFSQSDKNVLALLGFVLAAMLASYWLLPRFLSPTSNDASDQFEASVQNYQSSLATRQKEAREENDRKRKDRSHNSFAENGYTDREFLPKYNKEQPNDQPIATPQLAPFDPNLLDAPTAISLGIPPKTAKNIEKYLQKGGRFRKKEDLQKIYGLSESDYHRLEPYISIAPQNNSNNHSNYADKNNNSYAQRAAAGNEAMADNPPQNNDPAAEQRIEPALFSTDNGQWKAGNSDNAARRPAFTNKTADFANLKIDINSADTTEWKKLPGIGTGRAKMIVKFRNNLGGFATIEQVKETFALPPEVYDQIAPKLENKHPELLKKININAATYEQLNAHPYIEPRVAKVIVKYREQHGNYTQVSDLKKTDLVDDALLIKIAPYLSLQ